jgi:hypothetical protein
MEKTAVINGVTLTEQQLRDGLKQIEGQKALQAGTVLTCDGLPGFYIAIDKGNLRQILAYAERDGFGLLFNASEGRFAFSQSAVVGKPLGAQYKEVAPSVEGLVIRRAKETE